MNLTKIGWIGLGKMGVPMAQNLLNANFDLSLYNRSKNALANFEVRKVTIFDTPKALLTACEVVIVMISDDQAVNEVFCGENGLLSAEAKGKIVINMSTVSAEISRKMAALLNENGNAYIVHQFLAV
ncbi:MAG: NAD(P)-binding domain-containing protein [Bacteroidota bacterium]